MVENVNGMPAAWAARQARNFAVAVYCMPAKPDRGERKRQRDLLADDGGGQIALRDVHQHTLAQLDAFEVLAIGAQGLLRIGAGLGIVEEGAQGPCGGPSAAGPRYRSSVACGPVYRAHLEQGTRGTAPEQRHV